MKLKDILQTRTFRQSILTIFATVTSGVLGLLFYMLVARILGPYNFGIFAVATATLTLIADMGDLGADSGIIRFVNKYRDERPKALRFLKLAFESKVLVWLTISSLGWLITPYIVDNFFKKPELTDVLRFTLLGIGGVMLLSFSSHAIQAYQKYKVWSVLLVMSNLIRFLVITFLALNLTLNLQNTLFTYILIPFVFFIIGLFFLPNFFQAKKEFGLFKEFYSFNIWVFLISIIAVVSSRMDIFLTTKFLSIEQVGIYSAAIQLTSFIPQLSFAIATVAAPKFSSLESKGEVIAYLKKLQLFVLGLAVLGLIGIPVGYMIISYLYGQAYVASFTPFVILYIAQLIFLIALPVQQSIFYFFAKPQVFVPVALGQLSIMIFLGVRLINTFGITGAALTVLVGNLFLFLLPTFWVIYQFKK